MWFVLGGPQGPVLSIAVGVLIWKAKELDGPVQLSWRRKECRFITGLSALLAVWMGFEIFDSYPGSWLDRMFFAEPRAFEVDLRLVVDGEKVHLNRHVRCALGRTFSTFSFLTSTFHYNGIDSFGEVLKSGGAVIVITPTLCRGTKLWTDPEFTEARDFVDLGFLPLMGWMDNAKHPTVTELYTASQYYLNPKSRIKIVSYGYRPISPWWFMDGRDDFAYFTLGRFGDRSLTPVSPKKGRDFTAYTLEGIGEDGWSKFPALKNLQKIRRLEVLHLSAVPEIVERQFSAIDTKSIYFGNRSWPKEAARHSGAETKKNFEDEQKPICSNYGIVPLRMMKGVLTPSRCERGILIFYPEFAPDGKTKFFKDGCPNLKIEKQHLSCPDIVRYSGSFVFDPQERVLYRISKVWVDWPLKR